MLIQVGAYGHTLGGAVGIGFARAESSLTAKIINAGEWQVEIAGQRYTAQASLKPLYDPNMERVKC